uniref:sigma-70 family RNA polymerase sigma factor n=1 Tax=Nosocomiicoccus ampullae TaxID=489910 RepID=UPI000831AA91|nr:sigma-70 family RNA polymerase sigma factor [Nosocomiicoccus ampullae]
MEKIISYEPMIASIINRLNILYDRDEYMQIGRLAVYEALNKHDESICKESQFVYTMIYQRLIDEIRKNARRLERYQVTEDGVLDTIPIDSIDANLYLIGVKEKLTEREYAWLLMTIDGYALVEIAKHLGVSLSTAKNIRKQARKTLYTHFY